MFKNIILIISLFVFTTGISQEKKRSFSLEEAITFALDSSYATINARRDIASAIKKKWETTSIGLPQINAQLDYQNQLKQPVSFLPAAVFDPYDQIRNIDQFFDVTPNPDNPIPGVPEGFIPVVFTPKHSANVTATLKQLLFDGSYLVGLQAARVFLMFSENASEKTHLELKKSVINAYGAVLLAQENISVLKKNKTALEKNLDETREIYKNGLTEEESVQQLEITLIDIKNSLNNAERLAGITRETLNLTLGIDIDENVILTDELSILTEQNMKLSYLAKELDLDRNVDFKIATNLTEQRSLELKLEKSRALPTLSAFVNYGTNATNDTFNFFSRNQKWFQSSILGVEMTIPIFSSGERSSRTQQAKIALEKAKTDLKHTEQQIKLALATARSNYQFAIDNYQNLRTNLALAESIASKNEIKFVEGLATSFDLRQAQTQLYTAQQQYLQAMFNVIATKAELETVLGNDE